jgi:hypothetical protein
MMMMMMMMMMMRMLVYSTCAFMMFAFRLLWLKGEFIYVVEHDHFDFWDFIFYVNLVSSLWSIGMPTYLTYFSCGGGCINYHLVQHEQKQLRHATDEQKAEALDASNLHIHIATAKASNRVFDKELIQQVTKLIDWQVIVTDRFARSMFTKFSIEAFTPENHCFLVHAYRAGIMALKQECPLAFFSHNSSAPPAASENVKSTYSV